MNIMPNEKDYGTLWLTVEHRDIWNPHSRPIVYGVFTTKDQALNVLRISERFPNADFLDCGTAVTVNVPVVQDGRPVLRACIATVQMINVDTLDQIFV